MGEIGEVPVAAIEAPKAPAPVVAEKEQTVQVKEPVSEETVREMQDAMTTVPRLHEDEIVPVYNIPYRIEMHKAEVRQIFDEESGLFINAEYKRDNSDHLQIILSTPNLNDSKDPEGEFENMAAALREIYGESPELEKEIERARYLTVERKMRDKVKFVFDSQRVGGSDGFAAVSDDETPSLSWWEERRQVLDSGGKFLKGIVERAARREQEDYSAVKAKIEGLVQASQEEVVPNDESRSAEYAYHGTELINVPSIAELGLQPSNPEAMKEPGTIWFGSLRGGSYNYPGVALYRMHIPDFPDIAESWKYDSKMGFQADGAAVRRPIPPDKLELSLDQGKTWMPVVPKRQPLLDMAKAA